MKISRHAFLRLSGMAFLAGAARKAIGAIGGTRWGMAVDVAKCQKQENCVKCIAACNQAHNVPSIPDRAHEVRWVWRDSFEHAFPEQVDQYSPLRAAPAMLLCNHCENPPCVQVCPVGATYKTPDGVVLIDEKYCIGCRYCVQACPYGARYFNEETQTTDKCTWCYHRITKGLKPACVEVCPVNARIFGDLNDPGSDISVFIRTHRVSVLKAWTGNGPHVFYNGIDGEVS